MGKPRRSIRSSSIAAIHAGQRQLCWDVDQYRDFLRQITGKTSSKDLTDGEIRVVLEAMRARGFKRAGGSAAKVYSAPSADPAVPQLGKIAELWLELDRLGALNDPSMTSLRNFGKRVTGAAAPEFMTVQQRVKVIEALKAWVRRETPRAELSSTSAQPVE